MVSRKRMNEVYLEALKLRSEHPCLRIGQAMINVLELHEFDAPWPELFREEDEDVAYLMLETIVCD